MTRPNILIFMPDQLRADALGAFGNPLAHTPNIDALAARGTRFTQFFANHPVCSPSRVNFMTGWYPHTQGHRTLTHLIGPEDPNLLKYLKDHGYQVAWAGARGDVFAPGVTEASTHFCGWTVKPQKGQLGMGPQYPEGSLEYHLFLHGLRSNQEQWIDFDEACLLTSLDWIQQSPSSPWCLWVPLIFPHLPFEVEPHWHRRFEGQEFPAPLPPRRDKPRFHQALRDAYGGDVPPDLWQTIIRIYYAMVSRVDDQLGRLMRALELTGQLDDTLVLFLTDHGEYLGDFGLVEKWPSGMDRCLLQNPVIFAGPGIAENRVAASFAEMVDILPTLLEIADIEPKHTHFGRSLVPVLKEPSLPHRDRAFSEGGFIRQETHLFERPTGEYQLKGDLQRNQPDLVGRAICLRNERYTYVHRLYDTDELYDRSRDPNEQFNLVSHPEFDPIAQKLKNDILTWLLETADTIPWEPHPRFPPIKHGYRTDR
jgi:arylsulfatase A-like enzyme